VLGVGTVVEAAIGERAAQPFVKEQEEERDLNAFGGETIGVAGVVAQPPTTAPTKPSNRSSIYSPPDLSATIVELFLSTILPRRI
jgi:hypothetical protein